MSKKKNKSTPAKLDPKSSKNQSKIEKQIKLEERPLQLSFKDNLRKKITYFKSNPTFKFNKLTEEDEQKLKDCLSLIENSIIELSKNEPSTSLTNDDQLIETNLNKDKQIEDQLIKDKQIEDQLIKDKTAIDKSTDEQIEDQLLKDESTKHKSTDRINEDQLISDELTINKSTDKIIEDKKLSINKFRKDKKDEKKLKCKKQMEIIKNEFVFGFNEIVRKLKNNQLIGIILSFKLTSHIQQTILELAFNHKIPVLIVNDIEFYQKLFNISTISCLALLKNLNESIFNKFKQTFLEIDNKLNNLNDNEKKAISNDNILDELDKDKLGDNELVCDSKSIGNESVCDSKSIDNELICDNKLDNKINQNNEINKFKKNKKLKINPISIDDLWILKSDLPIKLQTTNLMLNVKTEFNKSEDLLIIKDDNKDDYFPERYLK